MTNDKGNDMTEIAVNTVADIDVPLEGITSPRHLISHSEVEAFGQCEQKHDYAHVQQLEPVTQGRALVRGNAGHHFQEMFLKAIKDEMSTAAATKHAVNDLYDTDYEPDIIGEVLKITKPWCEFVWPTLGWKVVDVEKEFRLTIDERLVYPFKVDAIVEHRGELKLVDHKFVYDPYDATTIRLMPQMPRYIAALRMMGIPVVSGIYNFMRTRELKDPFGATKKYTQVPVEPNEHRLRHSLLEQVQEMRKIDAIENTPPENRLIPVRTANKMNCGHCGFAELCAMELEGRDSKLMRRVSFQPNTYGYKELPE